MAAEPATEGSHFHRLWPLKISIITVMNVGIRRAVPADVPILQQLIEASVRGLQAQDYTPAQIEAALETVYGVDSQLIADGTYFVAEAEEPGNARVIVGCGGWSKRKTLFGGDHWSGRHDALLDPKFDGAKIRAFFVHPAWARRGIGGMILHACESAAGSAGFTRLEMGATLSGVPFYKAKGYKTLENIQVPLAGGESMIVVRMTKELDQVSR
jgi:GNAT superfamily N-acetyltransferase